MNATAISATHILKISGFCIREFMLISLVSLRNNLQIHDTPALIFIKWRSEMPVDGSPMVTCEAMTAHIAWPPKRSNAAAAIQTPIAIIIRFSVSEMNPSGTLLEPPTHAHFSSRLST